MQRILSTIVMLTVVCSPAFSQESGGSLARDAPIVQSLPDASERSPLEVGEFVEGQTAGQLVASDLVGRALYNTSGMAIGVVDDLFIDEIGIMQFVVVDVSEAVGVKKKVAFAFGALAHETNEGEIRLVAALDRATLEKAPSFTSLADAAALGDFQSLTEEADEPVPIEEPRAESQ